VHRHPSVILSQVVLWIVFETVAAVRSGLDAFELCCAFHFPSGGLGGLARSTGKNIISWIALVHVDP